MTNDPVSRDRRSRPIKLSSSSSPSGVWFSAHFPILDQASCIVSNPWTIERMASLAYLCSERRVFKSFAALPQTVANAMAELTRLTIVAGSIQRIRLRYDVLRIMAGSTHTSVKPWELGLEVTYIKFNGLLRFAFERKKCSLQTGLRTRRSDFTSQF